MNRKNEKGITLVALIVAIVVMFILASVTLNTTFTAYETTRAEKFKAQMKVLQESATSLNAEFLEWQKEKESNYREEIRSKELAKDEVNEEKKINSDGSLPKYFYENYNINAFLKEKKKKLNVEDGIIANDLDMVLLETKDQEGKDIFNTNIINSITADFYNIPNKKENLNLIRDGYLITSNPTPEEQENIDAGKLLVANSHRDVNIRACNFYEFNKDDLEYYLGVRNIDLDKVYINFDYLFIFTTDSVKVDGEKLYTQYAFSDSNTAYTNDTKSTINDASILVDVIANYGTSKKISLTLSSENQNNNNLEYRIRKAYYRKNESIDKGAWYEVDDLKECKYSEDGKSVTFIVYESGDYNFSIEDVSGGHTDKMKQNVSLNVRSSQPKYEEIVKDVDNTKVSNYNITLCNAPVLNPDMIPVKWVYNDEKRIEGKWVVCTTIDPEWYNYSQDYKMWANIMFDHDKNTTKELKPGVELSETEMGSMFVWIPRFSAGGGRYGINFLRGTSKTPTTGKNVYAHNIIGWLAFRNSLYNVGGWDSELKGLWFAKYDMGLEDVNKKTKPKPSITKVNTSIESVANEYNQLYSVTQNTDTRIIRAVSKPYYITWRNISYTNAFSQALMYYNNFNYASEHKDLNTHLMKSSELDVLYSITENEYYGNPMIQSNKSNKLSAGSDGVNGYSFQKDYVKQSSTGNITGIFDINGTTDVMISDIGVVLNKKEDEKEFLYNNLIQKINVIENIKEYKDIEDEDFNNIKSNSTKYYSIASDELGSAGAREGKYFIKIGEKQGTNRKMSSSWTKISQTVSPNYGFRIVMSNSPSGDTSNYLYDSTNVSEIARDDLPGFYVTDDDGNYIKNADGKFLDSDGNKTFYPWNEMIDNGWIKVDDGELNKGTNINELKLKTGILIISDSVKKTGFNVFEYWYKNDNSSKPNGSLLKVFMPDTITEIGYRSFYSCENLKEIKMSTNLKIIGNGAFYDCKNLVNYNLPESLEYIEIYAFSHCSALESIVIPRNVKRIGDNAFSSCSNVTSLEILSESTDLIIGMNSFSEEFGMANTGLKIKSLIIPANVNCIEEQAFRGCRELETILIEDGVKEIQNGAFGYCTKLNKINFPSSIESLGKRVEYVITDGKENAHACGVLEGCLALEEVDLSNLKNVKILQKSFFNSCSSLSDIKLPITGLEELYEYCFRGCVSLNSIKIPNTIKTIEQSAFGNTRLMSEEIPNIYLQYTGNKEEWENINEGRINNRAWYDNINIIVETSDGEMIEYN